MTDQLRTCVFDDDLLAFSTNIWVCGRDILDEFIVAASVIAFSALAININTSNQQNRPRLHTDEGPQYKTLSV